MSDQICALCRENRELELSHIVPKFVMRHLKKTAFGAIRSMGDFNRVIQDSEKHYLLCSDCEDLFSTYETKFANKFFYPYMKDNVKEFSYDADTYYFLTSVSWKSLYLDITDFVENAKMVGIDLETLDCLIDRERGMRDYLLKRAPNVTGIEHHLFFFEDIEKISSELKGLKPHTIFHRSITSYTFFNKRLKTYATLTNMMGMILFTFYSKGEDEYWKNTEIINGVGVIKAENQIVRSVCGNELIEILERAKEGIAKVSNRQQDQIHKRIKNDPDGFVQSKAFGDLKKDFNL